MLNEKQFFIQNIIYSVDATEETGQYGRLLNHSKKAANIVPRVILLDELPMVILVANRDICAGEELVYDYGDRLDI